MNSQQVIGARIVSVLQTPVTDDFAAKHYDVHSITVERPSGIRYTIELTARNGGEVQAEARRWRV